MPRLTIAKLKEIHANRLAEVAAKVKEYESYWAEERKKVDTLRRQLKRRNDVIEDLKPYKDQVRHIRHVTSYQFHLLNPDICFPPCSDDAKDLDVWSLSLSFIYNLTTDPDYNPCQSGYYNG